MHAMGLNSELSSVEAEVYVWHYALLDVHARLEFTCVLYKTVTGLYTEE